jgi:site-specific recombinase XerC
MNNPFASLDLSGLLIINHSSRSNTDDKYELNLDNEVSSVKSVRDRLIVLLRFKYGLRPKELVLLNVSDIDMDGGIVDVSSRKRNRYLVIHEQDMLSFKRWISIRKLYSKDDPALIISLHWTHGRSAPYQRMSVRGVFQVVEKYRVNNQ